MDKTHGTTGNRVSIEGWYTIYDLNGSYDIIVGKNWMTRNPHAVDHSTNALHMLRGDWTTLKSGSPTPMIEKSIVGLKSGQGTIRETRRYCETVPHAAGIHLVSAEEAWKNRTLIFVANIRFASDVTSDRATMGKSSRHDTLDVIDMPSNDFERWITDVHTRHSDLFLPPTGVPPPSRYDFRIQIDPLAKAPYWQPYHQSYAEREEFSTQIQQLIANRWVGETNSRFAAPIIFVQKAYGWLRMCGDYRGLNKITLKDRYPLPYIDDLLDRLHGSRYFTKLDLASGYHQLRIYKDDRHKPAFIVPEGLYEWKVVPFGLANAPTAFRRTMKRTLKPHSRYAVVYLDDIVVHSKSRRAHTQHVDAVLQSIRDAKLKLNKQKCVFGVKETTFVGCRISQESVDTEEKKVDAITSWPTPKNVGELKSFLGLAGYYRRFIEEFAHKYAALHE
jgi:hypothetical protein